MEYDHSPVIVVVVIVRPVHRIAVSILMPRMQDIHIYIVPEASASAPATHSFYLGASIAIGSYWISIETAWLLVVMFQKQEVKSKAKRQCFAVRS